MSRTVHFEIQATQPEQLIAYYSALFGWQFNKWDGPADYWLIHTGPNERPGIDGGLLQRCGEHAQQMEQAPAPGPTSPASSSTAWPPPVNAFVCTIDVDQIDEAVDKATRLGGSVAMPKTPIQGVGQLAYMNDPDGNLFGMMQMDPRAAMGTG